jgi:hypothetical protein
MLGLMAPPGALRSSALEAAFEALYRVFLRYAPRGLVGGCTHCMDEEEMARFTAIPLRAHTGESLGPFAFSAMNTWGDESDFKYYLPRILELFPFESVGAVFPELIADKLLQAGWKTWPEEERAAVRAFVEALWELLLTLEEGALQVTAEDALSWAARLFEDVSPLLSAWERSASPEASLHLIRLLESFEYEPKRFTRELGPNGATVARWLFRPQTEQRLEQAFFENPAGPYSAELATGADILHWKLELTRSVV